MANGVLEGYGHAGAKILDLKDDSLAGDTILKATVTLPLVNAMGRKPLPDQCRQILTLLAEPQKSE